MKKPMRLLPLSLLLIVSFLFLSPSFILGDPSISSSLTSIHEPNNIGLKSDPRGNYRPASGPTKTGVLSPIECFQSGINTETTGLLSARTDETPSVVSNLALDTAHGWKSDQIELNVSELRKQFVLNGTFGNGYPGVNVEPSGSVSYYPLGWDADSNNHEPTKQTMSASYIGTGSQFIELELEGEYDGDPWKYKIYKDSYIYWYQDATHLVSETDMLLEFDLLYDNGPIGPEHLQDLEIRIEAGSETIWSMDPVTIPGRDYWMHVGPTPVSLAGVPTSFELRFVFEILESRTFDGRKDDFDGDYDNAQYVRFQMDNLNLMSADYYDPQDVNLRLDVTPIGPTSITGSAGSAHVLLNHSYWEINPQPITILSDDPVSFDYEARFTQVYRNVTTCWTKNSLELGVYFSVDTGESPSLTAYIFVPFHSSIEDFTVELPHPPDYENVTVLDPLSTDVTSFCSLSSDRITITGSVLVALGWWTIYFETPNYAREITLQGYTSSWENQSIFNAHDQIRALVGISTPTSIPTLLENVSVDWVQPNGTLWFGEICYDGTDGVSYSQDLNLDALNATQGKWEIRAFWNNGTEIAYGETYFELFHTSSLIPVVTFIETEPSTIITVPVIVRDLDTNENLFDETSTVVGNWSGQVVVFQRNFAKAWWEADLNTSLIGFGNFTILINATTPYYSSSSCTVTVEIESYTILTHYGSEYVNVGLGGTYEAKFRYSSSDGTGIEDALVEVITVIGPDGGLGIVSTMAVTGQVGNYTVEFQVDIGGSYFVVVSASKVGYDTETVSFNIISSAIGTNLLLLNGTSDVMTIGGSYNLAIQYLNETGEALEGATISVVDVVPSSGLTFDPTQPQGNGTYTIMVNADLTGIYSISVRASLAGYDSQIRMFTLVVSSTPSILSIDPTVSSIAADQDYTLIVMFTDYSFVGLENGSISILSVNPSTGLSVSEMSELGSGQYSITLTPSTKGTYNLVLRGSLQNYQNSTALFTLVVTDVPTSIRTSSGLVSGYCYFIDSLEITLLYERSDNDTFIQGATIEISAIAGLDYAVVEMPQGYVLTISPTSLGHWSLSFRAFKSQYSNASMIFDFEVREAATSLSGNGLGSILYPGVSYSFMLSYSQNDSIGIDGATVIQTFRGIQSNPFSWLDNNDGTYSFTMTASELGFYAVSIVFSKYGFASAESSFSFNVSRHTFVIPDGSRLNSNYSLLQGRNLDLSLRLTTGDTGAEIYDAVVSFLIFETGTSGLFVNHTDGSYTATIPTPSDAGTYSLRISIQKDQYADTDIEVILISEVDSAALAARFTLIGVELAALFLGIASVAYVGRRRLRQTSIRKQIDLLNLRERFSDANNIIGFLVIQRSNGLPIYSRIIKGGFEMSIISGFISAISNFAMEIRTEEKLWTPIPISEVVTAVQTKELICALLTVDSPSLKLSATLEETSLLVGSRFDTTPDLLDEISRQVDKALEYKEEFDSFFETQFDFKLLVSYTSYDLSRKGEYPLIELAIISGDLNRPFYVSELVRYLVTSGVEETNAYSMVIEAAESGFILSLDEA